MPAAPAVPGSAPYGTSLGGGPMATPAQPAWGSPAPAAPGSGSANYPIPGPAAQPGQIPVGGPQMGGVPSAAPFATPVGPGAMGAMPQQPGAPGIPGGPAYGGYPAPGAAGVVPTATPIYVTPPCGPPPVPPPSTQPAPESHSGQHANWVAQGPASTFASDPAEAERSPQNIKTRKPRSLRSGSRAKSSHFALLFLLAAALFLVGVVIVLVISLAT